ncbi:MAG: hypothetical protein QOK43_5 [Acidimicrobiaceae bacterium]|nr:hypothetical protein [Acidimicrobiaceae bacterium]
MSGLRGETTAATVVVAHADLLHQDVLVHLLERGGGRVVGRARTVEELLLRCRALAPEVVVVSAALPDPPLTACLRIVAAEGARVVVVGARATQDMWPSGIRLDGWPCVLDDVSCAELAQAVLAPRQVAGPGIDMPPSSLSGAAPTTEFI